MANSSMVNGGDTGATLTLSYLKDAITAYNIKDISPAGNNLYTTITGFVDGAAPFIVDNIGKNWWANTNSVTGIESVNIGTQDSNNPSATAPYIVVPPPTGSTASTLNDGDGYIDSFVLKFSEPVVTATPTATNFPKLTLTGGGTLTYASTTVAGSTLTVVYTPDFKGPTDTNQTPALTFVGGAQLKDSALNPVASFIRNSYDTAPPVIIGVKGDTVDTTKLNITFSEPVWTHDSAGANISFTGANIFSNQLFGYNNLSTGPGASGFTAAPITQTASNVLQATLDANLTVADIAKDVMWLRSALVWDNANGVETTLLDNASVANLAGVGVSYWIMDDVVAPWIIGITTVDANKNGYISYLRVKFSEKIKDSSIKGYVGNNKMSTDVSSTWMISNYTGTAYWNFFEGKAAATDAAGIAGRAAAAAAGKPAFADNGVDDDVLYLEIVETGVPVFATTGVGTTGFKPTITWGTGANLDTITDPAGNPLDTASTVATTNYVATNGTVFDNVGPTIMSATASGKVLTVLFSEPVKDITAALKTTEFTIVGAATYAGTTNTTAIIGYNWVNNGTLQITGAASNSTFNWTTGAPNTVEILSNATTTGKLCDTAVAATNPLGIQAYNAAGTLAAVATAGENPPGFSTDPKWGLWTAASPVAPTPYSAAYTSSNSRGAITIAGLKWLYTYSTSDYPLTITPKAGVNVTLRWKSANIDSVKLQISYNSASSSAVWQDVPNSMVSGATGVSTTWKAVYGVTAVKVISRDASCSYTTGVTVGLTSGPFAVLSPNGNEALTVGQPTTILFQNLNAVATDSVDVSLSLDDGVTWTVLGRAASNSQSSASTPGVSASGKLAWTPAAASDVARIKISHVGSNLEDISDQSFRIITGGVVTPPAPAVAKAVLNDVPSTMAQINNVNVAKVAFTGTATAGDSISVKLVDINGLAAVATTVVANAAGNFTGTVNASPLANGLVTLKAGEIVGGAVATWVIFADYLKDAVTIGAPAALTITDVPGDNGGFVYVNFTVSAQHPGMTGATLFNTVQSYQLFKRGTVAPDTLWTAWALIWPADFASLLPSNKQQSIVATVKTGTMQWKLVATTMAGGSVATAAASGGSAKVAELLNGVDKAAEGIFSDASNVATGGSVDDIAPTALTVFSADNTPGSGITVSWTPNADHGIVAGYTFNGLTLPIWGVDKYEIYRAVKGTTTFTLVGFGAPGSTSYLDATATPGTTVYDYYIKLIDGNTAHLVKTTDMLAMSAKGGASGTDFNSDGSIGLADLVLLGQAWNTKKSTSTTWISLFDLNSDGTVDLGDLVVLGSNWGKTTSTAKIASAVPAVSNPFELKAEVNENSSMYFVNINVKDAATYNGVAFTLNYDTKAFEFVKESVNGLVGVTLANESKPGVIDVASYFQNEKFNGTITLGFKSKGLNSDMNLRMANAEIAINNVVSAVTGAPSVTLKALPTVYGLSQNFPNPFNPSTTITYSIPKTSHVELAIYNMAGQKIRTLVNTSQAASFYRVVWNGKNDFGQTVASGLYFYRLNAGNYSKVVKMNLIK